MKAGVRALSPAGRRGPAAVAARARQGPLQRQGTDRHSRPRAVRASRVTSGFLKESGLVVEERDGAYSFYRLAPAVRDDAQPARCGRCCKRSSKRPAASPMVKADESRLQEVLRLRRENFEHVSPDTRDGRQLVPGRSWAAWSRALGHAAAAARRRRSRLRRRLPDGRDRALGAARHGGRSLDRRARRAPRRSPRARG